jgi:hypothetical protein
MWKKFERVTTSVGFFSGLVGLYAFLVDSDKIKVSSEDYAKLLEEKTNLKRNFDASLNELKSSELLNNELAANNQKILNKIKELQAEWTDLDSKFAQLGINTTKEGSVLELFKTQNPKVDWTKNPDLVKLSESFDKYKDSLNNLNFTDNFIENIKEIIVKYQDWLHSLPFIKQMAIVHAIIGTTILISLISLLITYFSRELLNWLTKRYNIETKYPKIFKFLELRQRFQNYYFFISFFMSIFLLTSLILIDLKIFFNL